MSDAPKPNAPCEPELAGNYGPITGLHVMGVDGRRYSVLADGRISHGPDMGTLVIGVDVPSLADLLESMPADVRAERQRRGLSHKAAAAEMGVAYADLCRFELGKKDPQMSTLRRIAAWMKESRCAIA